MSHGPRARQQSLSLSRNAQQTTEAGPKEPGAPRCTILLDILRAMPAHFSSRGVPWCATAYSQVLSLADHVTMPNR